MSQRLSNPAKLLILIIGVLFVRGEVVAGGGEVAAGVAAIAAIASAAAEKPTDCQRTEPCHNYLCPPAIYNDFVDGGARILPGCQDSCADAVNCDSAGMPVDVRTWACEREAAGHDVYRVYFETNHDSLDADKDRLQLEGLRSFIKAKASCGDLQVIGFADAPGTKAVNFELSQRRAESVKHYIEGFSGIEAGVQVSAAQRCGEIGSSKNKFNRRVDVHAFCE